MIVVLDCNIWITLVINQQTDVLVKLHKANVQLASCQTLKDEITDVLDRPKLKKFIPFDSVEKISRLHDIITKQYKIGAIANVVSDEKDNYLFALCLKAKADYLVTGDKLILSVKQYDKTKTISLSDFNALMRIS